MMSMSNKPRSTICGKGGRPHEVRFSHQSMLDAKKIAAVQYISSSSTPQRRLAVICDRIYCQCAYIRRRRH